MCADEIGLNGHEVAIARREVDQRLHSYALLAQRGEGDAAHPHTRHRAVADVDAVDAGLFEQRRSLQHLGRVGATWRVDLDADDEFSGAYLARQG